jgi:MraZ protein
VAPPADFVSEYTYGLDAKSRVVMPAAFRSGFAAGGYLVEWQGECLAAMPRPEWDAYIDRMKAQLAVAHVERPDAVLREIRRSATDFRLDIQGRLTLTEPLRAAVGIGDEVRFVGQGARVELWPATETADQLAEREDLRSTISMLQLDYDVPRQGV